MSDKQKVRIYTDGASRGNPGPASYAFVIVTDDTIMHESSGYLGEATNNQAEYHAIINALEDANQRDRNTVDLFSDSKLVINQLNGKWRVKDDTLAQRYADVQTLLDQLDVTFQHVPRENTYVDRADTLCNRTLDKHM